MSLKTEAFPALRSVCEYDSVDFVFDSRVELPVHSQCARVPIRAPAYEVLLLNNFEYPAHVPSSSPVAQCAGIV